MSNADIWDHAELVKRLLESQQPNQTRGADPLDVTRAAISLQAMAAQIAKLTAERAYAEALVESLQNRWASRDLTIERLRVDAERYRWLRTRNNPSAEVDPPGPFTVMGESYYPTADELDAAIDAEMRGLNSGESR